MLSRLRSLRLRIYWHRPRVPSVDRTLILRRGVLCSTIPDLRFACACWQGVQISAYWRQ